MFGCIWNLLGHCIQILGFDNFCRIVNIKSEVAHDGEMIPQFLLIVFFFTQFGEQFAHAVDYGMCATSAFIPVFNSQTMFHHLMNVAPVLRQFQML